MEAVTRYRRLHLTLGLETLPSPKQLAPTAAGRPACTPHGCGLVALDGAPGRTLRRTPATPSAWP